MSSFTTPLQLTPVEGLSETFELTEPFTYHLGHESSDTFVTVPKGFITDGASIPRTIWPLLSPWGTYGKAAVVHDYLCVHRKMVRDGEVVVITREGCDWIFLEAMQVLGVSWFTAHLMWRAVRSYAILKGIK
ncbi:DUF1353 domain-containing protein [Pseudomonas sp. 910_23]|uniref:DUF1353 domain-containing protein n=1 Tax=Pseudomonas sp. 910_23 TaxID=2604461 RepID=UPI0040638C04